MSLECRGQYRKVKDITNHVDICVAKEELIFGLLLLCIERGVQSVIFFLSKFSHGACTYVLVILNAIENCFHSILTEM